MAEGSRYDDHASRWSWPGRRKIPRRCSGRWPRTDIADACDLFRPVYDRSVGRDGYVSLEVDPDLAYDTLSTYRGGDAPAQAGFDRPNLMVKIPATRPGLPAIEDVIAEGHLDQRDVDLLGSSATRRSPSPTSAGWND